MDLTPELSSLPPELIITFSKVKLFLCDVDGVLTDASVFIGEENVGERKRFNIQDGLGLVLLKKSGIPVGWISARFSPATISRAKELSIDFLEQGKEGKLAAVNRLVEKLGIDYSEILFMGDDVVDLQVMKTVGLPVAVANARQDILASAKYVTKASGGHGAVRETCDLLLKAKGLWDSAVKAYFI